MASGCGADAAVVSSSQGGLQIQKCSLASINNFPNASSSSTSSKASSASQQQQTILQQIQSIERRVFPKHESMADELLKEVKKPNNVLLIALTTTTTTSPTVTAAFKTVSTKHKDPAAKKPIASGSSAHPSAAVTPTSVVAGYLLYSNNRDDQGGVKILKVAVSEAHRRRGIGEALLREALKGILPSSSSSSQPPASFISLHVDPSRIPAVALYKKLGFSEKTFIKDYYHPGRDAYLMVYSP
eukprot:TRINITY_DN7187_c0_g1_i1.p1 TRINITY_DN7187_c0_g1~~TRINITY_DN7187_c0_g1_i1.p1  ORF type:complete len:242 (-),score=61.40 TRINITY_DN7187_c0_g1_i1:756-1481(-)